MFINMPRHTNGIYVFGLCHEKKQYLKYFVNTFRLTGNKQYNIIKPWALKCMRLIFSRSDMCKCELWVIMTSSCALPNNTFILLSVTEFLHCPEFLNWWSMRGGWRTYGDIHVQWKWSLLKSNMITHYTNKYKHWMVLRKH